MSRVLPQVINGKWFIGFLVMIKNLSRPNEPIAEGDLAEKQQGSMTVRWTQGALPTAADEARSWRDSELGRSDWIVSISDHPQRDAYISYRTALRDWPASENFPETRPELGG